MLEIALIFHSANSANLGVGALTVSEIDILRRLATEVGTDLKITLVDWRDARPPYVGGPDIEVRPIRSRDILKPWGYPALVWRADIVIDIGAGDSFADIYGPTRLRKMFAMKFIAHLLRRPLVVAPQTVGPFTKNSSRRLARATLRRSAVVASRDAASTVAARDLGAEHVIEASDVALRLPYTPPPPRAPGGPVRAGLNVSGLLMNGGYSRQNMFGLTLDYPALMRALIGDLMKRGAEVHLVPHVITNRGDVEDDATASADLAAEFPGVIVASDFATPSEAKSYIAGMDFFAGARMHACIAAFSSGVPVIPMAYSRKFEGLFGTLGYHRTVDCTRQSADAIRAALLQGFDDRATLQAEAIAALARGVAKLSIYEEALKTLMHDCLARKRR